MPKPWKTQKGQSKKDIEIEMFLPEDKPKQKPEKEEEVVIPEKNDFKV